MEMKELFYPKVSIVMPVFNRETFIESAIDSVLLQTYKDFELIIVDDGSTDNSVGIIKKYDDPRIRLLIHKENKGVAAARNTGYKNAKGKYIVVSDSDDINLPTKIEEQVEFLEKNPDMDIVGCVYKPFNETGFLENWFVYEYDDQIKSHMIFYPGVTAASMFRVDKIKSLGYLYHDETYKAAVDYDWFNKMPEDVKFANIPKPLYLYRWHSNQISTKGIEIQNNFVNKIRYENLKKISINPTNKEMKIHIFVSEYFKLSNEKKPQGIVFADVKLWIEKLIEHNNKYKAYDKEAFKEVVSKHFYGLCLYFEKVENNVLEVWDTYKYKNFLELNNLRLDDEKIIEMVSTKKIAVLGTLSAAKQLIYRLECLDISVNYIIDNNALNTNFESMNKSYKIYSDEILIDIPVDVLILTSISDSKFLLKENIRRKYPEIKVILMDQLLKKSL